ncbi:MAG: hypothetical protein ACOYL8_03295 [Patescibacteria group bacterium]
MKKSFKIFLSLSFLLFTAFIITNICSAQLLDNDALTGIKDNANEVRAASGLSASASVGSVIASIIRSVLALLAAIFLVLMIFSGFKWMTASGNESEIEKAQGIIKAAIIGLVVVLAAYAITYFVFKYLPFSASITTGTPTNSGLTTSPPN